METKIQKWGNSLALRIPKTFAMETQIVDGSAVDLKLSNNQLVITPIKKKQYKLNDLLAEVNESNVHKEVDYGEPVGKERL